MTSAPDGAGPGDERWYTSTDCPKCWARIDGISHRYWCPYCGWVSPPDGELTVIQEGPDSGPA